MRFQILTLANMQMKTFWVIEPCSLVEVARRFRLQILFMEAVHTPETSVCLHGLHDPVSQKVVIFI
jgi:hypothetical protein